MFRKGSGRTLASRLEDFKHLEAKPPLEFAHFLVQQAAGPPGTQGGCSRRLFEHKYGQGGCSTILAMLIEHKEVAQTIVAVVSCVKGAL